MRRKKYEVRRKQQEALRNPRKAVRSNESGIRGRLYEAARSRTKAIEAARSSTQEAAILAAQTFGMFKDASLDCSCNYFDTDFKKNSV